MKQIATDFCSFDFQSCKTYTLFHHVFLLAAIEVWSGAWNPGGGPARMTSSIAKKLYPTCL